MRCRELDIFKIRNFLRNCLQIFWEDFFGRISLFILLESANLFESLLLRFCLNREEEEEARNLEPWKCDASSSHLKTIKKSMTASYCGEVQKYTKRAK